MNQSSLFIWHATALLLMNMNQSNLCAIENCRLTYKYLFKKPISLCTLCVVVSLPMAVPTFPLNSCELHNSYADLAPSMVAQSWVSGGPQLVMRLSVVWHFFESVSPWLRMLAGPVLSSIRSFASRRLILSSESFSPERRKSDRGALRGWWCDEFLNPSFS